MQKKEGRGGRKREKGFNVEGYAKEYTEKIFPNLSPLDHVQGNEVLYGKFNGDTEAVYKYCLEQNKRWEEVLGYKEDPFVLY